ncbi:MAG TPA: ATP-dependent DNA helicase [Candidatus Paceibacterota bacterium]|nr:ATP-dependent DNA helicase [Candidatus Paceibacterota bacterium]
MPKALKTSAFDAAYAKLNPAQRKAVDTIEGPVMVIAGPGTGKTEILTLRIANIRRLTDTPPEAILALTFTESGAAAMRKRLARLMGPDAYHVRITTFHGFCNDIIKTYPEDFPNIIGSVNITDVDQLGIIQTLIDETELDKLRPANRPYMFVKAVLGAVNDLKRENIRPDDFVKLLKAERRAFEATDDLYHNKGPHAGKMKSKYEAELRRLEKNDELARLYAAYEETLRARHLYDYNDMILEVARALDSKKGSLLRTLQESYLYILVDEHQDTNKAQNHIVERIASAWEDPNVFLVGDEHQAIYRFQGASRENFHYFKTRWPRLTLVNLTDNYRSTQQILNAAHTLSPNALKARAGHKEAPVELWGLSAPEVEQYFIATKIKELIEGGLAAEETAVLYRDNKDAFPIARMLERVGVPYTIESDQDILEDEDVKKLIALLKAVQHYGDPAYLVPVLHIDFFDLPPLDVYKILAASGHRDEAGRRVNPYDIIRSEPWLAKLGLEAPTRFLALAEHLAAWKRAARNRPVTDAFEAIVRESGFLTHVLGRPAVHEKLAKLHSLFDQAKALLESKKDASLEHFFDYLDLIAAHDVNIKPLRLRPSPGRVRLMTAHRSKGQEFDVVLIAGATDSKWGPRAHTDQLKLPRAVYALLDKVERDIEGNENDDDERNLFYVALTRGRKQVLVTYAERNPEGREEIPCRFLKQIEAHLDNASEKALAAVEESFTENRALEFAEPAAAQKSAKDKAYLNDLFREQGLSVTALNNYLECPWRYFYTSLLRIPEAPKMPLLFGSAVDNAIKLFFDARTRGEQPDKEYLVKRFEEALRRQAMSEKDFEAQRARGAKALAGWFDFWHMRWLPRVISKYRVEGIELNTDPSTGSGQAVKILGELDKVEFLGDGNEVNVVDYKTGKPKSRNALMGLTKDADLNYFRQLTFYNLLLDKEGKYRMISAELDFIEPNERGKYIKEAFTITPTQTAELEAQIRQVANEILGLTFWNKTCDDPECDYCALRKMMR